MDLVVAVKKEVLFALWLGMPGDPDAEELACRLERINHLDDLTRHRIKREIKECLDDMLADDRGTAVA